MIIYASYVREKLEIEHIFTNGRVTECRFVLRSGGKISLEYEYKIGGILKYDSKLTNEITERNCNEHFIGKTFPVIYHPEDQSLSRMLFSPDDFEYIKTIFPDSLQWVVKYLKN